MDSRASIAESLDRSFGDGPEQRPVQESLSAGRRALARRRSVVAVATLAAVLTAAGTAWTLAPGDGPGSHGTGVVSDPTPTSGLGPTAGPSPSATTQSQPADPPWKNDETVRYVDGELQIRPRVTVHEHLVNPYDYRPPQMSDALDVTFRGRRTWVLAEFRGGDFGQTVGWSEPSNGWANFDAYVADQVALAQADTTGGDSGWPDTLRLTATGTVVASSGSEVLQRTDDPRLGDSFADPGTPTGAALVRAGADNFTYFVVWRVLDGTLDVITTPARSSGGPTFAELLDQARAAYASGEGLR